MNWIELLKTVWEGFWNFVEYCAQGDAAVDHVSIQSMTPVEPGPTSTTGPSKLMLFCLTIQSREGWYGPGQLGGYPQGTPSYVNNNPGNCKWLGGAPYPMHATGVTEENFLIFPTYTDGFDYLMAATKNICDGTAERENPYQLKAASLKLKDCSQLTILQYFILRDPSTDKNNPGSYAAEVAGKIGLPVTATMSEVLG